MTQTIVPFIAYEHAAAAIEWLTRAFGFRENRDARHMDADTVTHAELDVGDGSVVYLATPSPAYESPKRHRETCAAAAKWLENPWIVDGYLVAASTTSTRISSGRARQARSSCASPRTSRPPAHASTAQRTSRATAGCSSSADLLLLLRRGLPQRERDEPVLLRLAVDGQADLVAAVVEHQRAEGDDERCVHRRARPEPGRASGLELALRADRVAVLRRHAVAVGVEQLEPERVLVIRLIPRDLEERRDEEAERPLRVHHRPAAADDV